MRYGCESIEGWLFQRPVYQQAVVVLSSYYQPGASPFQVGREELTADKSCKNMIISE